MRSRAGQQGDSDSDAHPDARGRRAPWLSLIGRRPHTAAALGLRGAGTYGPLKLPCACVSAGLDVAYAAYWCRYHAPALRCKPRTLLHAQQAIAIKMALAPALPCSSLFVAARLETDATHVELAPHTPLGSWMHAAIPSTWPSFCTSSGVVLQLS